MIKRLLLATTCIAAFTMGSFVVSEDAEARRWRRWGRPYSSYYYTPRSYYYGRPYGSYYRGYYAPRVYRSYPRSYYRGWGPGYYYYGPRSGVSFSIGF